MPQITRSPHQRPQMHYARRTEHNTTEDEEEEAHLHYQSLRRHCTLFFFGTPYYSSLPISTGAPPFLLPIYTGPKFHTFWTPLLHYQSPRGPHKYTPLHIHLFPLPNTTGPHIHTLFFWTPLIPIPISTGALKYNPLDTPHSF